MVAGLLVFAFFGRWLVNSLQMLEKGMTIKTGQGEYIVLSLIAGVIPLSVVFIIAALLVIIQFAGSVGVPRICHRICLHSMVRVLPDPVVGTENGMYSGL